MRRLLPVLTVVLFAVPCASPQDRSDLLKRTAENYRHLQSYEITGRLTAAIPGSELVFHAQATVAAAGPRFVPAKQGSEAPRFHEVYRFASSKITDERGHKPKVSFDPGPIATPSFVFFRSYRRLSEGVRTVEELPQEVLAVDGQRAACSILQVAYDQPDRAPEERSVKYWIDPQRLLVVRQEFSEFQRHNHKKVLWHWVYEIDSVRINQPPPEWFAEASKPRADAGNDRPEWFGREAPALSLADLDGRQVTLHEMRGKVVVLDFWATWCGPCVAEMPTVEAIAAAYEQKGVEVWGIASEDPAVLKKWFAEKQTSLKTLLDPEGDTLELYKVGGLPSLLVIDRDGKIRSYYEGCQGEQSLRAAIDAALSANPLP